jgi:hypothetical protein
MSLNESYEETKLSESEKYDKKITLNLKNNGV